jgi:hypothetical protein
MHGEERHAYEVFEGGGGVGDLNELNFKEGIWKDIIKVDVKKVRVGLQYEDKNESKTLI